MPRPNHVAPAAGARRLWLRRLAGLACLGALAVYALAGCQSAPSFSSMDWPDWASFRSQSPDEDEEDEDGTPKAGTKLETPLVGEYVTAFGGTQLIAVEGVGLVTGLDKTGEDPPPSQYRTRLVEEMKKNGIDKPNQTLADPHNAMVLIKAYIPVNARKGDRFDVEVTLPRESQATSLAGGYLLEARLAEQAVTQGGRILDGHVLATASGPVLVSIGAGDPSASPTLLRKGRVVGGGKSKLDRDLAILLRKEFQSVRNTTRIASAIGKRFHGHDKHGIKQPMAEAKDDLKIELKVPEEYKENYPRYINVIRNLAFRESDIARRVRIEKLEQQLNEPSTSETAALRLEGVGSDSLPVLRRALRHEDLEVRFNAAAALTYMGEADGVDVLAEAAREEPAFRVYALAALAASKEAPASFALRELLKEKSNETRYGAFRALTVLNENDPAVEPEPMKGEYKLHVLNVDGPPLVHLTHHTKAEVVLFGADQELQAPAVLRAGPHIQVVAQSGGREVTVSRHSGGIKGRKVVSTKLADIIRACDELGANYPDVADLLAQANKRHNLPGELAIDALPEGGRTYVAKAEKEGGETGGKRTVGSVYNAPTIYAAPTSEAAAARDEDIKEVTAEGTGKDGKKEKDGKSDGEVRPAGAEADEQKKGGVTTADGEAPAPGSDEPGDIGVIGDENKWYDPRTYLKVPAWLDGSKSEAPEQSEPGAE